MSGRDGGPAYPGRRCEFVQPSDKFSPSTAEVTYGGLTVRQAYKIAAVNVVGYFDLEQAAYRFLGKNCPDQIDTSKTIAAFAAEIADAMLAEDAEFAKETPDA